MTPRQLVRHFGSQLGAARALGCSQSSVNYWVQHNHIPVDKQVAIQLLTRGILKANLRDAVLDTRRTFPDIAQRLRRRV